MSDLRFKFGKNWKAFSKTLNEVKIQASIINVSCLLGEESLSGKSFLDIGCGSGLSSLAAIRLGAKVRGFDYDQDSVEAAQSNLTSFAENDDWTISSGSVLDEEYMSSLGKFDVVYSWGVLHHTGNMWPGIDLASKAVKEGGKFALAIYNDQGGASNRWKSVKRAYVKSPFFIQFLIALFFAIFFESRAFLIRLVRLQNPLPFSDWNKRKLDRGMSVWHDVVDWVGGYPFEVAKPEEIFGFLYDRGFTLEGMYTCGGGQGCNEFLFLKKENDE